MKQTRKSTRAKKGTWQIVGALGLVDDGSTPAIVEPIIVDAHDGTLVAVTEAGFAPTNHEFAADRSAFVPLPSGLPVEPDRAAMLLSEHDVGVLRVATLGATDPAGSVAEWMKRARREDDLAQGFAWVENARFAALIVEQPVIRSILDHLLDAARGALVEGAQKDADAATLIDLSWRVQRAARGEAEGMALAAVAFRKADRPELFDFMRRVTSVSDGDWSEAVSRAERALTPPRLRVVAQDARGVREDGMKWKTPTRPLPRAA